MAQPSLDLLGPRGYRGRLDRPTSTANAADGLSARSIQSAWETRERAVVGLGVLGRGIAWVRCGTQIWGRSTRVGRAAPHTRPEFRYGRHTTCAGVAYCRRQRATDHTTTLQQLPVSTTTTYHCGTAAIPAKLTS